MILTQGKLKNLEKDMSTAVLNTRNPMWTGLGLNLELHSEGFYSTI